MPMTGEACDVAWRAAGRPVGAILAQRDAAPRCQSGGERSWIENAAMLVSPLRRRWLVPDGADASAWRLLVARALRAFADGYMALLLPAYLLALGLGTLEVGIVSTATMLGSALAT